MMWMMSANHVMLDPKIKSKVQLCMCMQTHEVHHLPSVTLAHCLSTDNTGFLVSPLSSPKNEQALQTGKRKRRIFLHYIIRDNSQ